MVLPEDEIKIYDETLESKLGDANQQLKKWITRWRSVIDHSMKRVKELAKENSKPIWKHFTANKPAKTILVSNNPLTYVYLRLKKKRSSRQVLPVVEVKQKINHLIS